MCMLCTPKNTRRQKLNLDVHFILSLSLACSSHSWIFTYFFLIKKLVVAVVVAVAVVDDKRRQRRRFGSSLPVAIAICCVDPLFLLIRWLISGFSIQRWLKSTSLELKNRYMLETQTTKASRKKKKKERHCDIMLCCLSAHFSHLLFYFQIS